MQTLALVKSTTRRDVHFNVEIQDKLTSHKKHRQSSKPIKSQSNNVIGVKRAKTCANESRLVGFTPAPDWVRKWRECFSTKQKKRRKAKPKRILITLDIQVKTTLASPRST